MINIDYCIFFNLIHTRRFKNFNALLSLETFNNSIALFSNGALPTTSLIKSRINLECFVRC